MRHDVVVRHFLDFLDRSRKRRVWTYRHVRPALLGFHEAAGNRVRFRLARRILFRDTHAQLKIADRARRFLAGFARHLFRRDILPEQTFAIQSDMIVVDDLGLRGHHIMLYGGLNVLGGRLGITATDQKAAGRERGIRRELAHDNPL